MPARFIGRRIRVQLGASTVTAFDGRTVIATHERLIVQGSQSLALDHYLEVLQRKPGALPGATTLLQARASGVFTPPTRRSGRPRASPTVTAAAPVAMSTRVGPVTPGPEQTDRATGVTLDAAARGGDGVTRRGRGVPADHASGCLGNPSEASLLHRIRGHDWRIATPDFSGRSN